jgi:hypothetical protein
MRYIARAPLLEVPAYAYDISDHGKPSGAIFPLTSRKSGAKSAPRCASNATTRTA